MATATIIENPTDRYLNLKKEQFEKDWGAKRRVQLFIAKVGSGYGIFLIVTDKKNREFFAQCRFTEEWLGDLSYLEEMVKHLEKTITDKIIYLFFNKESK